MPSSTFGGKTRFFPERNATMSALTEATIIVATQITTNPRRDHYKQQAINHSAAALRSLVQRTWVEQIGTFVPMPTSKIPGHRDFDDRIRERRVASNVPVCARVLPDIGKPSAT
jgi:hypothetical protein